MTFVAATLLSGKKTVIDACKVQRVDEAEDGGAVVYVLGRSDAVEIKEPYLAFASMVQHVKGKAADDQSPTPPTPTAPADPHGVAAGVERMIRGFGGASPDAVQKMAAAALRSAGVPAADAEEMSQTATVGGGVHRSERPTEFTIRPRRPAPEFVPIVEVTGSTVWQQYSVACCNCVDCSDVESVVVKAIPWAIIIPLLIEGIKFALDRCGDDSENDIAEKAIEARNGDRRAVRWIRRRVARDMRRSGRAGHLTGDLEGRDRKQAIDVAARAIIDGTGGFNYEAIELALYHAGD